MRAFILFICLLAFAVVSHRADADESPPDWLAARFWLQSADCALKTGKLLVLCRGDGVVPIGDVILGDDPGHALALGIYSVTTGSAAKPSDIARLNRGINLAGTILLAVLLFSLRLYISGALIPVFSIIAPEDLTPSPHPAGLGDACLAAILPLALLGLPLIKAQRRTLIAWLAIGVVCLAAASLLRQSTGMMGLAASVAAITIRQCLFGYRAILAHVVLLLAIFAAYKAPDLVQRSRDLAYHLQPAKFTEVHGPWHSLYIGLGVANNPFGIRWEDDSGIETVKRLAPNILFGTSAYFDVLKQEYSRIVTTHPREVLDIYASKLAAALQQTLPAPLNISVRWAILITLLAAILSRLCIARRCPLSTADAALVVAALYTTFFIGQAVLIHYAMVYMFPIQAFLLLGIGASLDLILRKAS